MINFLFLFLVVAKGACSFVTDPYPFTLNKYSGSYQIYYINATGTENIRCATPRSGCHTLSDTLSRVLGTRSTGAGVRTSEAYIYFTNGTYEPESDSITFTKPITIQGHNIYYDTEYEPPFDKVILKVAPTSKSLFTINNEKDLIDVKVQYMTFSIDSAQKLSYPVFTVLKGSKLWIENVLFNSTQTDSSLVAHSKSIIDASEGYLKLKDVYFRNITLASDPLLLVPHDIFFLDTSKSYYTAIESTHFENITRNNGDGSVFEINVELEKDEDISYSSSLQHLYFANCSVSSSNNGGAMYIQINTAHPTFVPDFRQVYFYGQGTANAGTYLYLATNNTNIGKKENYYYFFKSETYPYTPTLRHYTEGRPNEFVIQEDKRDKIDVYYEDRTIIIGGDNAVAEDCSTDAKPCTTFLTASKSANFSKAPVIWLAGQTIESSSEGITFGTIERDIRPRLNIYPTSTVLLESFTGTVFTVSFQVAMSKIDFKIKTGDGKFAPIVFSAAAHLDLDHITFSPENEEDSISLQDSLISVTATGSLSLTTCSVSKLEFAKVVITDAATLSRISFSSCSFSDLQLTESLLKTPQSKTAYTISNSKFHSITLKDQSLFDCTYTNQQIKNCEFLDITKESGNGTIWSGDISFKSGDPYSIWDCTFDNCTVKAGNGGAFYFNLLTTGTDELNLQLNQGKFINCIAEEDSSKQASTGFGGAIFVECSGLSTVTYTDTIQYSGEMNGKGKWLAVHINTKEGINFHNFSSIFPLIDDNDIVRVLGEDWEPIHYYPPEILINATLLKTTGNKCLNATEDEQKVGFMYICPTLSVANDFLDDYYPNHFAAKILHHNITYTPAIQELVPQLQTTLTLKHYRFINGSNDERTILVVPSFHPNFQGSVVSVTSADYPPVTFKDLTFSLNTTKGYGWNPLGLFTVTGSFKLDNVTINTLASTITPFDDFTNATSNTRTIYAPLDKSVLDLTNLGNYITLTNVLFENITLSNVPLLNVPTYRWVEWEIKLFSANFVKLHETNKFKDITRNEGNGAVLEVPIGPGQYFILGNFTFENCKAANGNGGAVAFVLDWDSSLLFGDPETNKDLPVFKNCVADVTNEQSADEVAGYGGAVYLRLKGEPYPTGLRLNKIKTSGGSAKSGRVLFAYGKYANLTKGGEYFKSVVSSGGDANDYLIGSYDQAEVPVETKNMANANGRKLWYQLWWVWLLVGLFILIVIAIIVIVIVCCCCKKSS